jgi:hypothetical protein
MTMVDLDRIVRLPPQSITRTNKRRRPRQPDGLVGALEPSR